MKLKIKHKYFKQIKSGKKDIDYRDAHITFVDEETGEKLVRDVIAVTMVKRDSLPSEFKDNFILFTDDEFIAFVISKEDKGVKK